MFPAVVCLLRVRDTTTMRVMLSALLWTVLVLAQGGSKDAEITGLVIDTGCYLSHNTSGAKHVACATRCAKAGVPLAILASDGVVYLPVAVDHKNQNLKLTPFIEQRVKVTGPLMEKGGMKGIFVKTIQAAQ